MMKTAIGTFLFGCWVFVPTVCQADNLLENGSFDHPENPFHGWIIDYAWMNNPAYNENKDRVKLLEEWERRDTVAKLGGVKGVTEIKLETVPIPFESGYRYQCRFNVRGRPKKGYNPIDVYFKGYRWKKGVEPHGGVPELRELQNIYRSAEAKYSGHQNAWVSADIEFPKPGLSDLAKSILEPVEFITVYIWVFHEGYIDDVVLEKTWDRRVDYFD